MANPFKIKKPEEIPMSRPDHQSAGILDDFAVRKVVSTREGTITKVPVNDEDIVNKAYCDGNTGGATLQSAYDNGSTININDNNIIISTAGGKKWRWNNATAGRLIEIENDSILFDTYLFNRFEICHSGNTLFQAMGSIAGGYIETIGERPLGNYNPATGDGYDLGTATKMWRDIYLARNLSDGTNSLTIANCKTAYDNNHARSHAVDGTSDHSLGSGTSGKLVQFDTTNILKNATNTNTEVADAVTKKHTSGADTTLGTMTADINMNNSYQVVNLQAPAANGEAIRATAKITEAKIEVMDDHVTGNTQAHSDYLLNSGADEAVGPITTTTDNSTVDVAYVPMVLYNTDATPPAANTFPIGTIYVQYTA